MGKMRYQQQIDETDCGPACIVMVASYYNHFISIGKARDLCKTDYIGTNLAGMLHAAGKLGFTANAMRGELIDDSLNKDFVFPFIAHIRFTDNDKKTLDHYVVVNNITKKFLILWDPDKTKGKHKIKRANFLKIWTGYVIFLSPNTDFRIKKDKKNTLLKFLPLVSPHKKTLLIISISSCILVILGIIIANYYKYIMDEIIIARASFSLTAFSIGAILIMTIQSILEMLRSFLITHFSFKSGLQLNFSFITHILKLPLSFFETRKTGEIVTRLNDISIIRETLSGTALSMIFDCFLIFIIGPILFKINNILFAISIVNVFVISIIIFIFTKLFKNYYIELRKQEADVYSALVEMVNGIYTIKSLNAEKNIGDIYEEKQMKAIWTNWRTTRLVIWHFFFAGLLNNITGLLIFWIGSDGIINDTFSFGTLLSFNSLLVYFTGPLFRLLHLQPQLQQASVAAERVSEILEKDVEQSESINLVKMASLKGDIEFKNVVFRYGMRFPLYEDLSFRINKGQWVAFVGPSGCGKTTIVKLLLKFYEPEKGTILFDGYDLNLIDSEKLRSRIGYVPQDLFIYAGTIAENIALGNSNVTMESIIEAAKKAEAHEFINSLPDKYETKLSEHGSTLSGGERQRIALSRALLKNHDILILDEATSNLDTVTERSIHTTIEKLIGNMTIILIAHRLSTIKNCDVIYVMDKGSIIEYGNHETLLLKNSLYKKMWEETII
jgi:ATP-binding cassette subfamily B protein